MGTSSSTLDVGKALHSLLEDDVIDNKVFSLLLETSLSNTELERGVPFSDLRTMRHFYTKNFAMLLFKCIEVIANVVAIHQESKEITSVMAERLQNAIRLLRRILPIAMESGNTVSTEELEDSDKKTVPIQQPEENKEEETSTDRVKKRKVRTRFTSTFVHSFFVENLACDDNTPLQVLPQLPLANPNMPIAKILGRLLVDCCFIRGLTLPTESTTTRPSKTHPFVDESLLWYTGVGGGSTTMSVNATSHTLRYELLFTLTVFLSYPLHFTSGERDTIFTEPLINVNDTPLLPTLVASALNALLSYVPFGLLPYSSHWVGPEELVVQMSARFLCVVICYPGAPLRDDSQNSHTFLTNETSDNREEKKKIVNEENNEVRKESDVLPRIQVVHSGRELIHSITAEEARDIVVRLQPIISLKLYSNRTYFPESQRSFTVQNEFMMLLWRLIDLSPECVLAFGQEKEVLGYILPLVDYAIDARRNPQYFPHLQLVLFVLLRLSGARTFCLQCNTTFREYIPFEFDSFVGSYNDLIIIMLCSFLLMNHEMIRPLHATCSAIISNLAPFVTTISPITSSKLSDVFTSVATRCLAYEVQSTVIENPVNTADVITDQVVMLNIVEAVASILQYHELAAKPLLASFMERKSLVTAVSDVFLTSKHDHFRIPLSSPFLITTISAAITAVEATIKKVQTTEEDLVAAIDSITLVGALPTPHRIVVKRLNSTWQIERWAIETNWSSLYSYTAPGTFGDKYSIKMLRFA
ncbi:putative protein HID1 isoform 1 [Trypanosoma theileri]|uniref:Dymeclin n=1 Tax=Trypanosoma theileri TaxID=67003 RepID=A0A1X0NVQ1_9TRYP|nr:putative protein HID1 isoform 1 [Trypanosoma theileri]ORC88765.1 putative protein HID1 isoform 1 [Trypanosoma theileri]